MAAAPGVSVGSGWGPTDLPLGVAVSLYRVSAVLVTLTGRRSAGQLLTLWESKANYFSASALSQLKEAPASWQAYQAELVERHAAPLAALAAASRQQLDTYKQQHEAFVQHALQQIQQLQQQLEIEQQVRRTRGAQLRRYRRTRRVQAAVLEWRRPLALGFFFKEWVGVSLFTIWFWLSLDIYIFIRNECRSCVL